MQVYTWREVVLLVLGKVGTFLADRRFWLAAIPFVLSQIGMLDIFEDEELQSLVDILVVMVPQFLLLITWTIRPPSGLSYGALNTPISVNVVGTPEVTEAGDTTEIAQALADAISLKL